jgi:hypothetical protein
MNDRPSATTRTKQTALLQKARKQSHEPPKRTLMVISVIAHCQAGILPDFNSKTSTNELTREEYSLMFPEVRLFMDG